MLVSVFDYRGMWFLYGLSLRVFTKLITFIKFTQHNLTFFVRSLFW